MILVKLNSFNHLLRRMSPFLPKNLLATSSPNKYTFAQPLGPQDVTSILGRKRTHTNSDYTLTQSTVTGSGSTAKKPSTQKGKDGARAKAKAKKSLQLLVAFLVKHLTAQHLVPIVLPLRHLKKQMVMVTVMEMKSMRRNDIR